MSVGIAAMLVIALGGPSAAAAQPGQWQPAPPPPGMQPQPYGQPQPPAQQPGVWQPAPVPGQPVPVQPQQPPAPPRTMPYQEGQPVPPGYHLEERSNWVLATIGFSQAGAMWLLSAILGLSFAEPTDSPELFNLAIPIVGPFFLFDDTDGDAEELLDACLVISAGVQIVGTVIGIVGLSSTKQILVLDTAVGRLEPVLGPGYAGLRTSF